MKNAKTSKRLPETLTHEEVNDLRKACTRSSTGLRNQAIIESMLGAGLRVSEVVALKPLDIDWAAGTIRVNEGKGGKDRVVPISADTQAHLQVWATRRSELGMNNRQHFFCGIRTRGKALSVRAIQLMLGNLASRAGMEKRIHPHMLRHTYATRCLDAGFSIREVQELLGHSDVSTTMIYTHVNPEALRRKIQGDDHDPQLATLAEVLQGLSPEARKKLKEML